MSPQLSFFDILDRPEEPTQSAEVVLLPSWTRAMAAQAAREILSRPRIKQAWHQRDQTTIFRSRVSARGLAAAAVDREVRAFTVLLKCELRRQVILSILWGEGDAA